jgi:hypothetical protein
MTDVAPDLPGMDSDAEAESDDEDDDENKDVRYTQRRRDKMIADDDGLISDSDGEDEKPRKFGRRNIANHRRPTTLKEMAEPRINGDWKSSAFAGRGPQHGVAQKEVDGAANGAHDQQALEAAFDSEELTGDTVMVEVPDLAQD